METGRISCRTIKKYNKRRNYEQQRSRSHDDISVK
jgi:hypothetical protein